ncbi:MAG: hypothetical protein RIA62_10220 [Cyclobacteriaceae bacterium]
MKLVIPSFLIILLIIVITGGCSSNAGKSEKSTKNVPAIKEIPIAKKLTTEESLFTLLSDWRIAQNLGDFRKYSTFYDPSFVGIKRAGKNTYSFHYSDWLSDRSKMFEKPFNVFTTSIKIDTASSPLKIYFEQTWTNATFKDTGPKVLHVKKSGEDYKITYEEMVKSSLQTFEGDASNITDREDFFFRSGPYLLTSENFTKSNLLTTEEFCQENYYEKILCFDIHNFSIKEEVDNADLINKELFIGSATSKNIDKAKVREYRVLNEELKDKLPGILATASRIDTRYSWPGFQSNITDDHTVIFLDTESRPVHQYGQWGLLTDSKPVVYHKLDKLSSDAISTYQEVTNSSDNTEYAIFTKGSHDLLVSYESTVECGEEFYSNLKLWEYETGIRLFRFVKEIADMPALIFDIEGNRKYEILYKSAIELDYNSFIQFELPYYGLVDGDTVFLSCGC